LRSFSSLGCEFSTRSFIGPPALETSLCTLSFFFFIHFSLIGALVPSAVWRSWYLLFRDLIFLSLLIAYHKEKTRFSFSTNGPIQLQQCGLGSSPSALIGSCIRSTHKVLLRRSFWQEIIRSCISPLAAQDPFLVDTYQGPSTSPPFSVLPARKRT